jgi:hypothetical protein
MTTELLCQDLLTTQHLNIVAHHSHRAMESVLYISELLEAILLHLDMTTLLVSAPRVSKTWHSVMIASPAIQQALYFKPIPITTSRKSAHGPEGCQVHGWDPTSDKEDETRPVLNPLLAKYFRCCFFDFGKTYGFNRRANLSTVSHGRLELARRPQQEDTFRAMH